MELSNSPHNENRVVWATRQKLKQVEVELMATIGSYLAKKHTGARYAFETLRACGHSVELIRERATLVNRKRKESLAFAVEAPETSTLREYCPA